MVITPCIPRCIKKQQGRLNTRLSFRSAQASKVAQFSVGGNNAAILAARHALYCQARQRNPRRWSGLTRNWTPVGAVTLNPEREAVVGAHSASVDKRPLAA
jgi:hypothetical protein